ncbi:MAG: sigma-70 family RNA polymerase sigma factor [Planctomycetes bacterium]|nr:sigma-70 family RNA polymerase sigma factor [Planctomycetota bacterium]
MTDSELVQGLRRRDPSACQALCDCYLPSLWRYVYTRVNGDQHLAEDITSETVLALLAAVESDSEQAIINPAGWLRTVAGRRVQDHFRAVARVRHLLEQSAGTSPGVSDADPARHSELLETRAEVRQVMDQLSDQYRAALEWKYLDKWSVKEIAEHWAITEKAVESILFRARREFRDRLTQREDRPAAGETGNGSPMPDREHLPLDQSRTTPRTTLI